jgi:hypothetical protein
MHQNIQKKGSSNFEEVEKVVWAFPGRKTCSPLIAAPNGEMRKQEDKGQGKNA